MEKETNKKTFVSVGKLGKALAIAGAIAGVVWYLKNSYKKELKNLSETKKEEDKKVDLVELLRGPMANRRQDIANDEEDGSVEEDDDWDD